MVPWLIVSSIATSSRIAEEEMSVGSDEVKWRRKVQQLLVFYGPRIGANTTH
jgi:hypothetical protein